MLTRLFRQCAHLGRSRVRAFRQRLVIATKPTEPGRAVGVLTDVVRSRPALVAENALLRHQLAVLRRSVKRPRCTTADRALLVLLASRVHAWRRALPIVRPETLLRWHRALFRRSWRRTSQAVAPAHRPPLAPETITRIKELAATNRRWGVEHIRGELLTRASRARKRTIQQYMRERPRTRPPGQA